MLIIDSLFILDTTFVPLPGEVGILNPNYPTFYMDGCAVNGNGATCPPASYPENIFCQIKGFSGADTSQSIFSNTLGTRALTGINGGGVCGPPCARGYTKIVCK